MIIEKNGHTYVLSELSDVWKIERKLGALSVEYKISKKDVPSLSGIKKYIAESEMF